MLAVIHLETTSLVSIKVSINRTRTVLGQRTLNTRVLAGTWQQEHHVEELGGQSCHQSLKQSQIETDDLQGDPTTPQKLSRCPLSSRSNFFVAVSPQCSPDDCGNLICPSLALACGCEIKAEVDHFRGLSCEDMDRSVLHSFTHVTPDTQITCQGVLSQGQRTLTAPVPSPVRCQPH